MNANELIERYLAGERDFSDVNLRGVDLSFTSLSQINLKGANLSQAVLTGTNLRRANLSFANLRGTHLERADLTGAKLFRTNLCRALLEDALLVEADLRSADLTNANLLGADLTNADLWAAKMPDGCTYSPGTELAQDKTSPSWNLYKLVRNFNLVKLIAKALHRQEKPLRRESPKGGLSWVNRLPAGKTTAISSWGKTTLTPEEQERLQVYVREIAQILHNHHSHIAPDEIATLESIQNACYLGLQYAGLI